MIDDKINPWKLLLFVISIIEFARSTQGGVFFTGCAQFMFMCRFYTECLGMKVLRRRDIPEDKYTNAFLGYGPEETNFAVELTYSKCDMLVISTTLKNHLATDVPYDFYQICKIDLLSTLPNSH